MSTHYPKGFIPIVVVIVISVVAALMVAVGLWYRAKKDAEPVVYGTVNMNVSGVFNQNSNTNTAVDETADWNIHTSQELGVQFKYPDGYDVQEQAGSIFLSKGTFESFATGANNAFFGVIANRKYFDEDSARLKNTTESEITIDGGIYKKVVGDDYGRYEGASAGKVVDILLQGSMIHIEQRPGNIPQDFDVLVVSDKILSTIQFLDVNAHWKTFVDDVYGYSFRYPPEYTLTESDNVEIRVVIKKEDASMYGTIKDRALDPDNIQGIYGKMITTTVNVGPQKGYQYRDGDAGCGGDHVQTALTGNKILELYFGICDLETNVLMTDLDQRNQILSTFQFTE